MTQHANKNLVCNALKAPYLFNEDKRYDGCYDTGDKYLQCGRKVDVLKLWLQRKAHGDDGIAHNIAHAFENVAYLAEKIHTSKRLLLVQDPACLNVCFWYIPPHIDKQQLNHTTIQKHYQEIHTLTAHIHGKMLEEGEMMTMFTTTKGLPNFFRMAIVSPQVTHEDLDFVIEHIIALGDEVTQA